MIHSFDVAVATAHGVECAIMLANIEFWIAKNKANRKHFHNGRFWTYNSVKAWAELFPYWNQDKVRRVLEKLEEKGLILSDNFNQSPYDRTKWYTLACDPSQIDSADLPASFGKSAKSLTRTDTKPDTQPEAPKGVSPQDLKFIQGKTEVTPAVLDWLRVRKTQRASLTETAWEGMVREARKAGITIEQAIAVCAERGWRGFRADWGHGVEAQSGLNLIGGV